MYIKRKLLAIIILIQIFLISCAPPAEGGFLRVLELAADAEIEGVRNGVEFEARFTQSARDADGLRTAKLEFTAPKELAGICVDYSCGVWGASLGEISFSGLAAEKLGAPLAAFLSDGEVVSVEKVANEDTTKIVLRSGALIYEYTVDSKSGLPVAVKETSANGENIMEIKIGKYEIKE